LIDPSTFPVELPVPEDLGTFPFNFDGVFCPGLKSLNINEVAGVEGRAPKTNPLAFVAEVAVTGVDVVVLTMGVEVLAGGAATAGMPPKEMPESGD